jgi:hypothetical protein
MVRQDQLLHRFGATPPIESKKNQYKTMTYKPTQLGTVPAN